VTNDQKNPIASLAASYQLKKLREKIYQTMRNLFQVSPMHYYSMM